MAPPHVPGFTRAGEALDEALSRSRGLTRLLSKAEASESPDERRKLVSEALRRSCELRDTLDEAERVS